MLSIINVVEKYKTPKHNHHISIQLNVSTMTRVLAFPYIGNLQVHNTVPRLDLTSLRHKFSHSMTPNVKYKTIYKYTSPKVYTETNGHIEDDTALIGAIELFRERMWFPPNTSVNVETRRTVITSTSATNEHEQWRCINDATKVGILVISQKNILGGYYRFKKHSDRDDDGSDGHIRTIITPGNMVMFEQCGDVMIDYDVSPMITCDDRKVGVRDTLILSV